MDEFAKNEHAKSDEFALLVGDLVYIPVSCWIFPRGSYTWFKAKFNYFKVSI